MTATFTALHTFTNAEDAMTAFVYANPAGGFNVTLRDDDSGHFVDMALVRVKEEAAAVAKAKIFVGV